MVTESPDLSGYVDLTIYDKDPQDIFDAALVDLQARLPDYVAYEGSIDALLLEEFALEVSEAVYALNRVPGAVVQTLFELFGVVRSPGTAPTVDVTFSLGDTLGHLVPAGTRVRLDLGSGLDPLDFTTDENLLVDVGFSDGTVSATALLPTADANGVPAGTAVALVDSIFFVDSVATATPVANGVDPEDTVTWLNRASAVLARLNSTLVTPAHFSVYALEDPNVSRAFAVDSYASGYHHPDAVTAVGSAVGGALTNGATYDVAVTAYTATGETTPATITAVQVPAGAGAVGSITLNWSVPRGVGLGAIVGYKVYRNNGAGGPLGLTSTIADASVRQYVFTGAGAPGAAPPAADGTAGAAPGYVTVAVYGPSGPLAETEKNLLADEMSALAQANLGVGLVDATVTPVDVTVSVVAEVGVDPVQLQADVVAALESWLSPQVWPWASTVRRNALIAEIGSVIGVAYVDTLTVPAADVAVPGVGPLTTPGVLNVTVET